MYCKLLLLFFTFTADAEALLSALIPPGQWVWTTNSQLFTGSLRHSMQQYHYQQYLVNRDDDRERRNTPPRWIHNCFNGHSNTLQTTPIYPFQRANCEPPL